MDPFSPETKPKFTQAEAATAGYPGADTTPEFDHELEPLPELSDEAMPARGKGASRGYEERWRLIAKFHARGYTNNQIARHLGYSATGVSLALKHAFTQAEVAAERSRLIDDDAITIMKETSVYAAQNLRDTVLDRTGRNSHDASKFVLEKVTGKARQEVTVESGTLGTFMELLKQMQGRGELIDVSPAQLPEARRVEGGEAAEAAAPQQDPLDLWLDQNR